MVYHCAKSKLNYLWESSETGSGKAMLAELRHGAGRAPGEVPEVWGLIFDEIPDELTGTTGASDAEWALYTALTLYALHQQGAERNMNADKISLGTAAAMMAGNEDELERIRRRMHIVVTAASDADLANKLRSLVQLLNASDVPLDFALLAKDLYLIRSDHYADDVKLKWGRDFFKTYYSKNKKDQQEND